MITSKSSNIRIKGHYGSWYVIGTDTHMGKQVYLLEHEEYGDETPALIVDGRGNVLANNVYNGFDDLEEMA